MKSMKWFKLPVFIVIAALLLQTCAFAQEGSEEVPAAESEDESVIELDFQSQEDIEAYDKTYGDQFENGDVKLRVSGYSEYYIQFLNHYSFHSLDLEIESGNPVLFVEKSDGSSYYLSDVKGLEKLKFKDHRGINIADAGVFSDLKELSLTENNKMPFVFGRVDSSNMPALETMKIYYSSKNSFEDHVFRVRGLYFPGTLKNLEMYIDDQLANVKRVIYRVYSSLLVWCPNVKLNGLTLQELWDYNMEAGHPILENDVKEGILETLMYKTYSDVIHGRARITEGDPPVGGKLVFMIIKDGEVQSVTSYDGGITLPEEYKAYDLEDTDMAIILYDEQVPPSEENPSYQTASMAIFTDLRAGIVYAPVKVRADDNYYPYDAGNQIMEHYNPSFRSSGTLTYRDFSSSSDEVPEVFESISDDTLQAVLDALDNETYRNTMTALLNGDVITNGTYSETAAGLQQTLADFGCEIAVDGSAGPATFQNLNYVLSVFGMNETDTVDADLYAELMPLLLLSIADEETAREVLRGYFAPGENSSEFDYMRGCALYVKGLYYSARDAFEESNYRDYEYRARSCVQPFPQNGELWHNGSLYSQSMYLTFVINDYDVNKGTCFEVLTDEGTPACLLFVNGNGSVTTSLPGGVYRIREASGSEWYGTREYFGREGSYEYLTFDEYEDDPYRTFLEGGYEWTISINASYGGESGVGTEYSDWDSWRTE